MLIFPFSALDKIIHWDDALKQANSSFLPGGPVLLVLAMIVEFVTPICIVTGWYDRIAAFILALFCVVTAFLYHPFWKFQGFWFGNNTTGRSHFWDFLKNFGLAGGLMLVIGNANLQAHEPHPYSAPNTQTQAARSHSSP